MRRFYLLGLAMLGVLVCGVAMASSAFAVAEWLLNGLAITGEDLVETKGTIILIHLAGGFLEPEAKVECEGIFDGVVLGGSGTDNKGGEDLVTELLDLNGNPINSATPLHCKALTGCEKPAGGEEDTFVFAENLPWLTKLEGMAVTGGTLYLDLFTEDTETYDGTKAHLPAYNVDCLAVGVLLEALCEGETSADITLDPTTLLGVFNRAELEGEKLEGTCIDGMTVSKEVAIQEGNGEIVPAGGGELDVSN